MNCRDCRDWLQLELDGVAPAPHGAPGRPPRPVRRLPPAARRRPPPAPRPAPARPAARAGRPQRADRPRRPERPRAGRQRARRRFGLLALAASALLVVFGASLMPRHAPVGTALPSRPDGSGEPSHESPCRLREALATAADGVVDWAAKTAGTPPRRPAPCCPWWTCRPAGAGAGPAAGGAGPLPEAGGPGRDGQPGASHRVRLARLSPVPPRAARRPRQETRPVTDPCVRPPADFSPSPSLALLGPALPAARAAPPTPAEELLRFVPPDVSLCLVVRDLAATPPPWPSRPSSSSWRRSPLGKQMQQTWASSGPSSPTSSCRSTCASTRPSCATTSSAIAVVVAYRLGPPGKPQQGGPVHGAGPQLRRPPRRPGRPRQRDRQGVAAS